MRKEARKGDGTVSNASFGLVFVSRVGTKSLARRSKSEGSVNVRFTKGGWKEVKGGGRKAGQLAAALQVMLQIATRPKEGHYNKYQSPSCLYYQENIQNIHRKSDYFHSSSERYSVNKII